MWREKTRHTLTHWLTVHTRWQISYVVISMLRKCIEIVFSLVHSIEHLLYSYDGQSLCIDFGQIHLLLVLMFLPLPWCHSLVRYFAINLDWLLAPFFFSSFTDKAISYVHFDTMVSVLVPNNYTHVYMQHAPRYVAVVFFLLSLLCRWCLSF